MLDLIRDLCSFRTGVVADGNTALLNRISREVPLQVFKFASGEAYNGWQIPDNWQVKRAKLFRDGREIFDFTVNALGVGYYSRPFVGDIDWRSSRWI